MECPYTFGQEILTYSRFPKLYYVKQNSTENVSIVKLLYPGNEITEMSMLSTLRSDHLLHSTDILTEQNCETIGSDKVGMVIPVANNTLKDYLGQNRWDLIFQSIYGVAQLHNLGYLHLDLKAENILIFNSNQGESRIAKVADFGSSVFVGNVMIPTEMNIEYKGTQMYSRPSRLKLLTDNITNAPLSYADDIYSLALLMIYNVIGNDIYFFERTRSLEQLYIEIKNAVDNIESFILNTSYASSLTSSVGPSAASSFISLFVSLIKKMTKENPITAEEILFDPFFQLVRESQYDNFKFYPAIFDFDYLTEEEKQVNISNEMKIVIDKLKLPLLQRRYPSLAFDILIRVLIRKKMISGEISDSLLLKYINGAIEIAHSIYSYLPIFYIVYPPSSIMVEEIYLLRGAIFRKGLYYAQLSVADIEYLVKNFTVSDYEQLIVSLNMY